MNALFRISKWFYELSFSLGRNFHVYSPIKKVFYNLSLSIETALRWLGSALIPLASLFIGGFLFSVPQTIDLLRDYDSDFRVLLFECLRYLAVATVIWALPIYISCLYFYRNMLPLEYKLDRYVSTHVPFVLALGTYLIYANAILLNSGIGLWTPEFGVVLTMCLLAVYVFRIMTNVINTYFKGSLTWAIIGSVIVSLSFIVADPLLAASVAPRATMIPVLAGFWVPLVTAPFYFAARAQTAAAAAIALVVFSSTFMSGDYSIRVLENDGGSPPPLQLPLRDASDRWRAANGCQEPATCPQPVIIAISGGASRSAFVAATIIGRVLDSVPSDQFRKRVFAISGVSGGSLGGALVAAALSEANGDGMPPCRRSAHTWYRYNPFSDSSTEWARSWEACLQILASGDFLTPVVITGAFNDVLPFRLRENRAVTLERSWESHYRDITQSGTFEKDFNQLGREKPPLPSLILNASAIPAGGRLLISHLDLRGYSNRPVSQISDFRLSPTAVGGPARSQRLRLSTAVSLSARFPIVTPHGVLYAEGPHIHDGYATSYVVDGGFVDNYGAATTLDIVQNLVSNGYDPVVVLITNDPRSRDIMRRSQTGCVPEQESAASPSFVSERLNNLLVSIGAITSVWNSQGLAPLADMCKVLQGLDLQDDGLSWRMSDRRHFIHIGVDDNEAGKALGLEYSMSWWLSKTVQSNIVKLLILKRTGRISRISSRC